MWHHFERVRKKALTMSRRTKLAWRLLVGGSWFKWSGSQTCCTSNEDKTVAVVIAVYSCKQLQVKPPPHPPTKKKSWAFKEIWTHGLCICAIALYQLNYKNPYIEKRPIVEFILACERYEINYQDVLYFRRSQHLHSLYLHLSKSFTLYTFFMAQLTDQLD